VTFIFYNDVGIIFPGDLEKSGWEEFLSDPAFVMCLGRTNIFIASHHGRLNGYSDKVFGYCNPQIIILSDKAIEHDTQSHDFYRRHAKGIYFGDSFRRVITTRNDGKITIDIPPIGQAYAYLQQAYG
jgi:hypothetical protein